MKDPWPFESPVFLKKGDLWFAYGFFPGPGSVQFKLSSISNPNILRQQLQVENHVLKPELLRRALPSGYEHRPTYYFSAESAGSAVVIFKEFERDNTTQRTVRYDIIIADIEDDRMILSSGKGVLALFLSSPLMDPNLIDVIIEYIPLKWY